MPIEDKRFERVKWHLPLLHQWVLSEPRDVSMEMFETDERLTPAQARAGKWRPVKPGVTWGKPWSSAWFRIRTAIPRSWRGRTVALRFRSGQGLAFRKGKPVYGLNEAHDRLILTEKAAGGEREIIYIEAGASERFGKFTGKLGVDAGIAIYNRDFEHTVFEMEALMAMAGKLPRDDPLRKQILRALNRALDAVDRVFRFRKGAGVETCFTDRARLHGESTAMPHLHTLATPDEIAEAARLIREECAAVRKPARVPYLPTIHAVGHAHIDLVWMWPLEETIRKCARTWSTALAMMDEFPEYVFLASQGLQYAICKQHYPDLYKRIHRWVKTGRWEPLISMWVESDCMCTGGESIVRQFLWGVRFARREFGDVAKLVWIPDSFGFCAQMPQIVRRCGLKYFASSKLWWNDTNSPPFSSFWWQSLDGSRVLTHFQRGYCRNPDGGDLVDEAKKNLQSDVVNDLLYVYGHSDGGGGPTRKMAHLVTRALRNQQGLPPVKPDKAEGFFRKLERKGRELPTWVGEHYNEFHRGTYTTQARTKRGNRLGEAALREAELWAVAARGASGRAAPKKDLTKAWDLLLRNQFHDVLPGTSIGIAYERTHREHAEAIEKAETIRDGAFKAIAERVDTRGPGIPFLVFNPLSWSRSAVVELPANAAGHVVDVEGRAVPQQRIGRGTSRRVLVWAEDVPACGHAVYRLVSGRAPAHATNMEVNAGRIRTPYYEIALDRAGRFTRLFDRRADREILPSGKRANALMLFNDLPSELNQDAWDLDAHYRNIARELDGDAEVRVVERGPVRATIRLRHAFGESVLEQDIHFYAHTPRIDFVTRADWHESHKLLKVSFPADLDNPRAFYEVQFGHLERSIHANTTWEAARFEVPAQRWADLSEPGYGISLLNDCKHGHDVHDGALRLSLLRAPKRPDIEADMGAHRFTYGFLSHAGDFRSGGTIQAGYELNHSLRAIRATGHAGALPARHAWLETSPDGVVIEAVKPAEDGNGFVIRVYEAFGARHSAKLALSFPVSSAHEVDLLEQPMKEVAVRKGALAFVLRPFEIRSFLVKGRNG